MLNNIYFNQLDEQNKIEFICSILDGTCSERIFSEFYKYINCKDDVLILNKNNKKVSTMFDLITEYLSNNLDIKEINSSFCNYLNIEYDSTIPLTFKDIKYFIDSKWKTLGYNLHDDYDLKLIYFIVQGRKDKRANSIEKAYRSMNVNEKLKSIIDKYETSLDELYQSSFSSSVLDCINEDRLTSLYIMNSYKLKDIIFNKIPKKKIVFGDIEIFHTLNDYIENILILAKFVV